MKNIVIFASGSGTNAENLTRHFLNSGNARVTALFCNNLNAAVLGKADALGVPSVTFTREELASESILLRLQSFRPDLIVLAGFLLKFPDHIIAEFPQKVVNIHPALLPKYGGKGMYGLNVHQAVLDNAEKETGITIHYVDGHYDNGDIIFQATTPVDACTSAQEIAAKVQELEQQHFPLVIENLLRMG